MTSDTSFTTPVGWSLERPIQKCPNECTSTLTVLLPGSNGCPKLWPFINSNWRTIYLTNMDLWVGYIYRSLGLYAILNFIDFFCKFHLTLILWSMSSECKMQIALSTFNKLHVWQLNNLSKFECIFIFSYVLSYCLNIANSCLMIMKKDMILFCRLF